MARSVNATVVLAPGAGRELGALQKALNDMKKELGTNGTAGLVLKKSSRLYVALRPSLRRRGKQMRAAKRRAKSQMRLRRHEKFEEARGR